LFYLLFKKIAIFRGEATSALAGIHEGPLSWSNWNLECFVEGGKPENLEKNPQSKDEKQQQTQPTYDTSPLSPLCHSYSPIKMVSLEDSFFTQRQKANQS